MSNTKKLTKREKFEMLKGIADVKANPILAEFIDHELELLARKNASGGEKKMTAVQIANEGIKTEILECMGEHPNQLFTISEMLKSFPCCAELTNQKVSALVRQLVADGKVVKVEEKRKAFFKLA